MKTSPLKICITSLYAYHCFHPEAKVRFGGAELQLYYLARELAKDPRFDVNFIVADFGQPAMEIREGVKLFKIGTQKRRWKYTTAPMVCAELWKCLKKINADVYLQRASGIDTGVVALFCKWYGKKFIYMAANDEDVMGKKQSWMPKGLIGWLRWRLLRLGLRYATAVIVQHEQQQRDVHTHYGKKTFVRPSAHPLPTEGTKPKKNILWVSRCDRMKRPLLFLELAQHFPQESFVMVCPDIGDTVLSETVYRKAHTLPNVTFVEHVPFNAIEHYFAEAKIFVNTSYSEGFPNTFVQAAMAKTPIASLQVDPSGMLEKEGIGVCASGDFEKMKSQIQQILSDQEFWEKMSERAWEYGSTHHALLPIIERDISFLLQV